MNIWNFRILAKKDGEDHLYQIYRVDYNENHQPISHTLNPTNPVGYSKIEVKWELEKMMQALQKPVLSYENFPDEFKPNK